MSIARKNRRRIYRKYNWLLELTAFKPELKFTDSRYLHFGKGEGGIMVTFVLNEDKSVTAWFRVRTNVVVDPTKYSAVWFNSETGRYNKVKKFKLCED